MTSVGTGAFKGCIGLNSITLSKNLKTISSYCFQGCSGITKVSIPAKVTTIGAYAFNGTNLTSVFIPSKVTTIGTKAFSGLINLKTVSGGRGLKTIGISAFAACPSLRSFKITSSKLSKISSYAFNGDNSLGTLYIKNTTKLTKKGVKNSLKGSKLKVVKVKKSKVKTYKKYFKKSNSGRKVKVTK